MIKEYKEKQPKPKKEKPVKAPKAPKPKKEAFGATFNDMGSSNFREKPKKERKVKAEKTIKAEPGAQLNSFGSSGKVVKERGLRKEVNPRTAVTIITIVLVVAIGVVVYSLFGGNMDIDDSAASKLLLVSTPHKTRYFVGESASYSGLSLLVTMHNGASYAIGPEDCEISGFDSSAPAESQTITVTYENLSVTYDVIILADPAASGSFNGLSFKTLPKTEYKVGDWPSVAGGILLLHYDNGETKEIELQNSYIYDFRTDAPGTYTVTVKYVEDGYLATCTYTITVTE